MSNELSLNFRNVYTHAFCLHGPYAKSTKLIFCWWIECLWKRISYQQTSIPFHKTAAVGNCRPMSPNSFAYDPVWQQRRILTTGGPMHTTCRFVSVSSLGYAQAMSDENCYFVYVCVYWTYVIIANRAGGGGKTRWKRERENKRRENVLLSSQ